MVDYPGMLIINPNQKISLKSSGGKGNMPKQETGFPGAKSAIGGKKALSGKMHVTKPKITWTLQN